MKNKMTAIWEKLEKAKDSETLSVARQMADYMSAIEDSHKELESILNLLDAAIDSDAMDELAVSVSKWKNIHIGNVNSKEAFEQIVIALTGKYNEGKKSKAYGESVAYTWETKPKDWNKNITVTLTVETAITGCKIVTEKVYVPEKVTPAHEEERTIVKCEE